MMHFRDNFWQQPAHALMTVVTKELRQPPRHQRIIWLFFRGLALLYLAAFASMLVQIEGLIGSQGLLPVQELLAALDQDISPPYFYFPTIFWLDASDSTLTLVCVLGGMAALLLLFNTLDRVALIICYLLYCSLAVAGQTFTAFQWDSLLLEMGFLAILLSWGSPLCIWMYRWLLARFMFMGGVVKIASHDPNWANFTALQYHYQTQPLPSPLAYYAHFLPDWWQHLCTFGVLLIELVMPFAALFSRTYRVPAAWSFIALQCAIMLTGNYTFFNLLTLLLCLLLFEDKDLQKALPGDAYQALPLEITRPSRQVNRCATAWFAWTLFSNAVALLTTELQRELFPPLRIAMQINSAWSLVNNYGPFAVMTTTRPEIIIQGSNDGTQWQEYQFNYKPGALEKPLSWNIPHQPRLDWQLWFAALQAPATDIWFQQLMLRLQQGSASVLGLIASNPFPEHPPIYLRALLFRYYYTPPAHFHQTGQIWQREYLGQIWPPATRH